MGKAMKEKEEQDKLVSRRGLLKGSAMFLAGGAAGYLGSTALGAVPAPTPAVADAPALPWPWVTLDPLEAGRLAYRSYLEKKG